MSIGPIMMDLQGFKLSAEEKQLVQHPLIGGLIYFSRNYESPEQIKALSEELRALRPDLLISVDQEGGRVQRFKQGFTRLPPMQAFLTHYRAQPEQCLSKVRDAAWLMATELMSVGIDFSFAPVLDMDDQGCEVIADRSFSPNVEEVIALAGAWITGMQDAGMAATGKHFPGHGQVSEDSHLSTPVDRRSFKDIAAQDMQVFRSLAPSLAAMMPAHILFPEVDAEHTVGFSRHWLQTVLRQQLGFEGVIFSDDLSMAGAASAGSYHRRAMLALQAGCDMILVCNNRQGVLELLDSLEYSMSIESQKRLQGMRGKPSAHLGSLKQSSRWQASHSYLLAVNT